MNSDMLHKTQRELIIKLSKQKKKQQEIAQIIGCSQCAVSKWIQKSKNRKSLENLPKSGRPTKLNPDNLTRLKQIFQTTIKNKNDAFGSVTTKELREMIQKEIGELYSIRHIERLMHKLNFSLITPRTMHIKHDQKAVDAFRDEFKKKLSRNIWIMK